MASLDDEAMGKYNGEHVTGSDGVTSPSKGQYCAVQAIGGDATFGPGCEVPMGEAPREDDVLAQGQVRVLNLDAVDVKSGTLYCYYDREQ
jgi:hypothetical protein